VSPSSVTPQLVYHSTFVIERVFPSTPARVFAAWSVPEAKRRWMICGEGWVVEEHVFEFRVGGRERLSVGPAAGPMHVMEARYHDITAGERIIYAYDMYVGPDKLSVSLVTLELDRCAEGTRMRFTEQGAFLRGEADAVEREEGTRLGFDSLSAELDRAAKRGVEA
jgi:uncharacterized protein YndB with AHSA1/START domain